MIDELDKPFSIGSVSARSEIRALFLGEEDEWIVEYIKNNGRGCLYAHLLIYFVLSPDTGWFSDRRLRRRLKGLVEQGYVVTQDYNGHTFYFYNYEKDKVKL